MATSVAAKEAIADFQRLHGLPVTGVYDAATRAGIINFQRSRGLPVSGVVDVATVKSIQGYASRNPATSGINRPGVNQDGSYTARGTTATRPAVTPAGGGLFTGQPQIAPQDTGKAAQERDASVIVTNLFKQYGLESLAPKIAEYIKAGYSTDAVSLMLSDTNEYKTRFAGNTARIKAGLSVLSPGEYLATEKSYGQIMRKYGLPSGFHDQPSDYQKFIENDVSAVELDKRASDAQAFINQNDPQNLAYFRQYYSNGDMIAFALDPNRAAPLVGKAFEASQIGGAAATQGIQVGKSIAEDLRGRGISAEQATQGFGMVATDIPTAKNLSAIYGGQELTTNDLIDATFKADAAATTRKNKLASQERAAFGGSGGAANNALSSSSYGGV